VTVRGPYVDSRKPGLPYTLTVRYGTTNSLIEHHRYPSEAMAAAARRHLEEHGLDGSGWPTHVRP
jgi:hypothetical protein